MSQSTQDEPVSLSTPDHPYVLHVFTDLVQIPALVLNEKGRPETGLALQDFKLQIDSGPLFRPAALHVEGNEPLNLALVLDASGAQDVLLSALTKSPTHGFPKGLLPQDHIGVYAFDCKDLRSNFDTAAEVATTHDGIARILASPNLHRPNRPRATCFESKGVWDAVGNAAIDLGAQTGRRAIILISDGNDIRSKTSLQDLLHYLIAHSIAVFVMYEPAHLVIGFGSRSGGPNLSESSLSALAARSGGIAIPTLSTSVSSEMDRIVTLLRSRYILQFPRPSNGSAGDHHLDVQTSKRGTEIYAAGISVPLRDVAQMADPTTVPADTSKMPVQGKVKK